MSVVNFVASLSHYLGDMLFRIIILTEAKMFLFINSTSIPKSPGGLVQQLGWAEVLFRQEGSTRELWDEMKLTSTWFVESSITYLLTFIGVN